MCILHPFVLVTVEQNRYIIQDMVDCKRQERCLASEDGFTMRTRGELLKFLYLLFFPMVNI